MFKPRFAQVPWVMLRDPHRAWPVMDLAAAGERGREAADHLRQEKLKWHE